MSGFRLLLIALLAVASVGAFAVGLHTRGGIDDPMITLLDDGEELIEPASDETKIARARYALDLFTGSALGALLALLLAGGGMLTGSVGRLDRRIERLESRVAVLDEAVGGPEVFPPPCAPTTQDLIRDLGREDRQVRLQALRALRCLGSGAVPARDALETTLRETNGDLVMLRAVATTLLETAPGSEVLVTALIGRLGSDDASVRDWAAHTLGRIGPGARAAVPALIRSLDDPSTGAEAQLALRMIGGAEARRALRRHRRLGAV